MAIAFRASTTKDGANAKATSFVIDKPAGVVDGDFLLLAVSIQASQTVTTPSGWTLYQTSESGTNASNIRDYLYYKFASSEPSSYTITLGFSFYAASITAWTGVDTTTPLEANFINDGSSTSVIAGGVTTLGADRVGLFVFGQNKFPAGASNLTTPSGTTSRAATDDTNMAHLLVSIPKATAGSTGDKISTSDKNEAWATISISMVPAAGGSGQSITGTGIGSAQAFGSATVVTGAGLIVPPAIASAQAFGTQVVSGGAVPENVAEDTFTRSESIGWGTSDSNHDWDDTDDVADFTVDGSRGKITIPDTSSPHNNTLGEGVIDVVNAIVQMEWEIDTLPSSGFVTMLRFYTRRGVDLGDVGDTDADDIRHAVRLRSTGSLELQHDYSIDGVRTEVNATWFVTGKTYTAGDVWHVRAEVEDGDPSIAVRTRIWKDGDTEPSTWDLEEAFDPGGTKLDHGGTTGVHVQTSVGNTAVPFHVYIDDLKIADADAVSTTQTVAPSAVASAQILGTAVLSPGAVSVVVSAIASAQAFGTQVILRGARTLLPGGIASDQILGTAIIIPGTRTLVLTGISSGQAFGSHTLTRGAVSLLPTGIASDASFGTLKLNLKLVLSGLSSAEVIGTAKLLLKLITTAISSEETLGTAQLTRGIVNIVPSSIVSAESINNPVLSPGSITLAAISVDSLESLGSLTVLPGSVSIVPSGVGSEEALGTAKLNLRALISSISPAEVFGNTSVLPGIISVAPSGIVSIELFGDVFVSQGAVALGPGSIESTELLGSPVLSLGGVTLILTGVGSTEVFGTIILGVGQSIVSPIGILSGEALGSLLLSPGTVTLLLDAIASDEEFGPLTVGAGSVIIVTTGLASSEVLGLPSLTLGGALALPLGIPSSESFGNTILLPGAIQLLAPSIDSLEAFGNHSLSQFYSILTSPIGSRELFGQAIVLPGEVIIFVNSITTGELFGSVTLRGADLYQWIMQQGFAGTRRGGFPPIGETTKSRTGGFSTTQSAFKRPRR